MPLYSYDVTVNVPIEEVWDYVANFQNWAPLISGFVSYTPINSREIHWVFVTNLVIYKKRTEVISEITTWRKPSTIVFNIRGVTDELNATVHLYAKSLSVNQTKLSATVQIAPEGFLSKLIISQLESSLDKKKKGSNSFSLTEKIEEAILSKRQI